MKWSKRSDEDKERIYQQSSKYPTEMVYLFPHVVNKDLRIVRRYLQEWSSFHKNNTKIDRVAHDYIANLPGAPSKDDITFCLKVIIIAKNAGELGVPHEEVERAAKEIRRNHEIN